MFTNNYYKNFWYLSILQIQLMKKDTFSSILIAQMITLIYVQTSEYTYLYLKRKLYHFVSKIKTFLGCNIVASYLLKSFN